MPKTEKSLRVLTTAVDKQSAMVIGAQVVVLADSRVRARVDESAMAGYSRRAAKARREYSVGFSSSWTWRKNETVWKNGRPRTVQHATVEVRVRSVAMVNGHTSLVYDLAGAKGVARAPRGYKWLINDGALELRRSMEVVPVACRDIILGLFDGANGRDALRMPSALRSEFGEFEFGSNASEEIAKKVAIVEARVKESRRLSRDTRAVRLLSRSRRIMARMSDAQKIGLCQTGIRLWAQARGINTEDAVPLYYLTHDSDDRARRVATMVAREVWAHRLRR